MPMRIIQAVVAAALALSAASGEARADPGADVPLTAGAGRAEVALTPTMLPIDGFTSLHDPLSARVLVLARDKKRAAIAVVDQTSIFTDVVDTVKATVSRATGVPEADVLVVASHTFSAPHIFDSAHLPPGTPDASGEKARVQTYRDAVLSAVERAARDAAASMQPARIGYGQGASDVNVNRNVAMADGWWLGADAAGPSDKQLGVVRVNGADGRTLALLVNYAVQSSVMDHAATSGGKAVTDDLGGIAVRHVERAFGKGAVAMFLTGAAGDQSPAFAARRNAYDKDGHYRTVDAGDAGFTLLDAQGERLGEDAVLAAQAAAPLARATPFGVAGGSVTLTSQERPREIRQISPTRSYPFRASGPVQAPFVVLSVGDLAIIGVQAELSAATGRLIKQQSPFAHTLVVTMVNGAAKYMPVSEDYRRITYEAMNSAYAQGSAERFAEVILGRLRQLHDPAKH